LLAAALLAAASAAAPAGAAVDDWRHIREVAGLLQTSPPADPVVYYIADSTARESVRSETELRKAIGARTGFPVKAYVLGSSNQTFSHDRAILAAMPQTPGLVVIGVGLSRFTNRAPAEPPAFAPIAVTSLSPWAMHKYSTSLTAEQKRAQVRTWLSRRYPVFKKNVDHNLAMLELLVQDCQAKGWRVMLVDLPLNQAVVRHAFDTPRARYRTGCEAIRDKYGVPFVRFNGFIGLRSPDFHDIIHLIKGGRAKWQPKLATEAALRVPLPASGLLP
jgi:hypothetical protein